MDYKIPFALAASVLLTLGPAAGAAQQVNRTTSTDGSLATSSPVITVDEPVITVDEIADTLGLAPAIREEIASHVRALNVAVEQLLELQQRSSNDLMDAQREELHGAMREARTAFHESSQAIEAALAPDQQPTFRSYIHERMKAAGLRMMGGHGGQGHGQHSGKKPAKHP